MIFYNSNVNNYCHFTSKYHNNVKKLYILNYQFFFPFLQNRVK